MQQARGIEITDPLNSERFMRRLTDDFFHCRVGSRKSKALSPKY